MSKSVNLSNNTTAEVVKVMGRSRVFKIMKKYVCHMILLRIADYLVWSSRRIKTSMINGMMTKLIKITIKG